MIDIGNRKIYILIGLVVLLLFFFSTASLTVSTSNNGKNNNGNNTKSTQRSSAQETRPTQHRTASDKLSSDLGKFGLPEQDEYMSQTLRNQLTNLETKFYYDNCRYSPL